jgi:anti-sigma28 factor (negative regulator of flagellin synthesis)
MPSQSSTPSADPRDATTSQALPPLAGDAPSAAEKGAATTRRRKEEERADRLDDIRAQIEDGTLVVRRIPGSAD